MTKEELRKVLEEDIDNVFKKYMDSNDIKTGDISPHQSLHLDNTLDSLTELIYSVCEMNRTPKYYTKEEVIKYVKENTPQYTIDVGAPRDFVYNEHLLEEGEKYYIDGNTIYLYLE